MKNQCLWWFSRVLEKKPHWPYIAKRGAKCKGKGGLATSYPSSSPFMYLCIILVGGSSRAGDRRRKRSYRTSIHSVIIVSLEYQPTYLPSI